MPDASHGTPAVRQLQPPNAFDFIRVMAALAVLYSHSFVLYGQPEPLLAPGKALGSVAVAVFFSLSGFLICQSWQRDPSLRRFALRRALRIFPGLLVVVLLTVLLLGPLVASIPPAQYFSDPSPWLHLVKSAFAMGSPRIKGVFETNPFPYAVNGSLWTLRYEILMYMVLAGTGRATRGLPLRHVCLALFAGFALLWCMLAFHVQSRVMVPGVWRLGTEFHFDRIAYLGAFFFGGALANVYFERIKLSWFAAAALLLAVALVDKQLVMPLLWLAVPYCVLVLAFRAPPLLRMVHGYDYS